MNVKKHIANLVRFNKLHWREFFSTTLGIFGGIGTISFVSYVVGAPLLIASFGASAVLIYAATSSPLAQPRNVVGGHMIAALVGATFYQLMGETWYSITLAVTVAILLMMMTQTVHPPGGATAIVTVLNHGTYSFVVFPVMLGVLILLFFANFAAYVSPYRAYPHRPERILEKKRKDRYATHPEISDQ